VAEEVWPYSLHHQIWPAIKSPSGPGFHPNLSSHLFPELQFSVYNVNQASPVTLCRLDIDAFLNATGKIESFYCYLKETKLILCKIIYFKH
jgi:E3 SUMO-protein ligase RanBP2